MRRILLVLAVAALLAVPAVAAARGQSHTAAPGYLVVQNASADGGVKGPPVATVVVHGYVVGHIAQQGAVKIFRLAPSAGELAQASGVDLSRTPASFRGRDGVLVPGTEFSGNDFRFRAVTPGGIWRVVVYGAGVSLYAGGEGNVHLHGSTFSPRTDGRYSVNGGPFASMPSRTVRWTLGQQK